MATPYATTTDLVGILPSVTVVQAERLLDQVAARLDATLEAVGYTAPATGANDLVLLGSAVLYMAAAQGHRELYEDADAPERVAAWERQFKDLLSGLAHGTIKLRDQVVSTAGGLTIGSIGLDRGAAFDTEYEA